MWFCRIKPLALILFYRSSSELLPVLGGSRWRDGICQPFVSSHVSCSLLRCANYTNGSSSSVSALMPQWALHIGIHSEIFHVWNCSPELRSEGLGGLSNMSCEAPLFSLKHCFLWRVLGRCWSQPAACGDTSGWVPTSPHGLIWALWDCYHHHTR